MVSTGPLLCALLAAARLAIGTVGGCIGAETRVGGIDLALSTVIRGVEAASSGTRLGIGHSYDDTASDRANQYNGRVFDPGTGFHDYGARMYWPQIGRFVSADSYQGDPANPASLNRYSYVHNNPYKYTDPTGHVVQPADAQVQGEYYAVKAYLHKAKADAVINQLENDPATVTIRDATAAEIAAGSDFYYDPATMTIVMNANSGLLVMSGQVQTPALGVLHEAGHALQHVKHPAQFQHDHNTPDPKYDDKEEKRDVKKVETPAAKKLGEGTRDSHGGTPIPVKCVTCMQ